jgi:hypothetical protein
VDVQSYSHVETSIEISFQAFEYGRYEPFLAPKLEDRGANVYSVSDSAGADGLVVDYDVDTLLIHGDMPPPVCLVHLLQQADLALNFYFSFFEWALKAGPSRIVLKIELLARRLGNIPTATNPTLSGW